MKLFLKGHTDLYPVEQLQMQMFPDEPSEHVQTPFFYENGAVSALYEGETFLTATAKITWNGKTATARKRLKKENATVRLRRQILQQAYYLAAVQVLGKEPPWGALAGVRPTKLSTKFLLDGGTRKGCDALLRDTYFVSPARRNLCIDSSLHTIRAAKLLREKDLSLYIGIPFCPTRCAYCSFVSLGIEKFGHMVEPFLQALLEEVKYTGELLKNSPYTLRTLYIGGGTPTILSTTQMSLLLKTIRESFDLSQCLEFTVEGGRPDTLSQKKLSVIQRAGVTRMSINPQTMNDAVLEKIGRKHTAAEALEAYRQAEKAGFKDVNMDLIAGLPGDTPETYRASLEQVIALNPTNITVHTLALKKGADLFFNRAEIPTGEAVSQMLNDSIALLRSAGYEPYYLYRQKYASGSFENVGWCKPGHAGLYNIYMMEELHSILALGGGGMNKVNLAPDVLERFHNPKYPKEYIERLSDVLDKKKQIFTLLP